MRISEHAANIEADAHGAALAGGYLRLYDASETLLAECRFQEPAFELASSGMAKAHRLKPDPDCKAQGRPVAYRAYMADGKTLMQEGSAGTKDADVILKAPWVVEHAELHVLDFWYCRRR